MKKHIYNEQTGIGYTLQGDYYFPDLSLPIGEEKPIGIWGQQHLKYIKQHRRSHYTMLLTSGKLNSYLADINAQAENMMSILIEQMIAYNGITERLKAENQIEWVARMNNIRASAMDIVNNDLIYK